ncbi:hypothetical protein ASA1KI_36410 [Opitutales bacterium ASA1]|nr:hypothetical protein ASA1KI_36410 [Opitutales bacterium ASA1]
MDGREKFDPGTAVHLDVGYGDSRGGVEAFGPLDRLARVAGGVEIAQRPRCLLLKREVAWIVVEE